MDVRGAKGDRERDAGASPAVEFPAARGRDRAAFLPALLEVEASPPHPVARVTSAAILALVTAAVVWASVGRVDEVAVAPGRLVPRGEVQPVQPAESGVVRAVHVTEGQRVRQGEVVVELDPTDAEADRARLGHELAGARRERERLAALRAALEDAGAGQTVAGSADPAEASEADALQDDLLRHELATHRAEVKALEHEAERTRAERTAVAAAVATLEATLPLVSRRVEAARRLSEAKLAADQAYLELEQSRREREGDLKAQRARLLESEAAIQRLEERRAALEANFRRGVLVRLAEADRRVAVLEEERRKAEHRHGLRTLQAPVGGVVQQLAVRAPGTVVGPAQPVLVVVPDGTELEVEARLANRDVGFVRAGQTAAIKLEAFPFTRYGTVPGTVTRVSRDAVVDERQGLAYALRVSLGQQSIAVGSQSVDLAPGMAVTAEVKTGERRLIDFFLSPLLRYRDEGLRER